MYAVVEHKGSQIKVTQGEVVNVDLLDIEPGQEVVFDRVLLLSGESGVKIGKPAVDGASVVAEVLGEVKGKKTWGVSFPRRKSSRVRKGHRQKYTKIRIKEIKA